MNRRTMMGALAALPVVAAGVTVSAANPTYGQPAYALKPIWRWNEKIQRWDVVRMMDLRVGDQFDTTTDDPKKRVRCIVCKPPFQGREGGIRVPTIEVDILETITVG